MGDRGDEAVLRVIPMETLDPGGGAERAVASVAGDHETGGERFAVFERDDGAPGFGVDLRDPDAVAEIHTRIGFHRVERRGAKMAVLRHPAKHATFRLAMIEVKKERGGAFADAPVRDQNVGHFLRVIRDGAPDAHLIPEALRTERHGIGAAVETAVAGRFGRSVERDDVKPRGGQRQRGPGAAKAATHHDYVAVQKLGHGAYIGPSGRQVHAAGRVKSSPMV